MSSLPPELRSWLERVLGPGVSVSVARLLPQAGEFGPWHVGLEGDSADTTVVVHAGDHTDPEAAGRFRTEAAALTLAGEHHLTTPRLLAVDADGSEAGRLAMVQTFLPGESRIPAQPSGRLEAFGRVIASVHQVTVRPGEGLLLRSTPLSGVPFETLEVPERSREVLDRARGYLRSADEPEGRQALVHGDMWLGNSLWEGSRCSGIVDWDFAGVGAPGIDLGSARCDAAVLFGAGAADRLLDGWRQVAGEPAEVPHWDVVAALSTPPDFSLWLPNFHGQGRTDLDPETVNERRDRFLAAALSELGA